MKLNIDELAREAELSAVSATPQPVKVGDGDKFLKLRDEFFARLIVERCAAECDSVYYQNIGPAHGEVRYGVASCAAAIRNLLEAE
jgi:hypothetical protein